MNPRGGSRPEHAPRAYFRQPVWKRIVVIAAGPVVNLVIAFVLLTGLFAIKGNPETLNRVAPVALEHAGDRHAEARRRPASRSTAAGPRRPTCAPRSRATLRGQPPVDGCTAPRRRRPCVVNRDGRSDAAHLPALRRHAEAHAARLLVRLRRPWTNRAAVGEPRRGPACGASRARPSRRSGGSSTRQGAQGGLRRRRLLRGHARELQLRLRRRRSTSWRSSRCASR